MTAPIRLFILCLLTALPVLPARPARAEEPPAPAGIESFAIGSSVQGQPLQAFRLGVGARSIVLVGAIHGSEGNTADLVWRLLGHFATIQHLIPPDASLYFVPVLNPDGLEINSRYNANGVDLNRNWDSGDWQPDTEDASGRVVGGGGSAPFSEPESAALAAWLQQLRDQSPDPVTTVMYHSQYPPNGLVLGGSVGTPITPVFGAILGYTTNTSFGAYPVTGTVAGWCRTQNIGCFDVELPNRAPVSGAALQRHVLAVLSVLLWNQTQPGQRCFIETGYCIAGSIRAFWERHGGLDVFGLPITGQYPLEDADGTRHVQWFERARLEWHPDNAPPYDVLLGRLGVEYLERQGRDWWLFERSTAQDGCIYFPETEHNICGAFLAVWQANGLEFNGRPGTQMDESLALFGQPLSDAQVETLPDGQTRTVQWFERARFELHPDAPGQVRLGLLGTEMLR